MAKRNPLDLANDEVDRFKEEHANACAMVAKMHAAAVGEVTGPRRGVVEDVEDLRAERDALAAELASRDNDLIDAQQRADKLAAEVDAVRELVKSSCEAHAQTHKVLVEQMDRAEKAEAERDKMQLDRDVAIEKRVRDVQRLVTERDHWHEQCQKVTADYEKMRSALEDARASLAVWAQIGESIRLRDRIAAKYGLDDEENKDGG